MEGTHTINNREDSAVAATLLAFNKRLEGIRQEHLAKNRSSLRHLTSEQLQEVERLTAAITGKIFREVADELRHSATKGEAGKLTETVSLMLGLA